MEKNVVAKQGQTESVHWGDLYFLLCFFYQPNS